MRYKIILDRINHFRNENCLEKNQNHTISHNNPFIKLCYKSFHTSVYFLILKWEVPFYHNCVTNVNRTNKQTNKLVKHANFDIALKKNLRGHNWVHFAHIIVYCYHEFKLRYLKNQKLFSIRVKELFKPIVLRNRGDGFLLLQKHFLEKPIFEKR